MRTTPGMPGSAAHRRGSPVSVMLPAVAYLFVRRLCRELLARESAGQDSGV